MKKHLPLIVALAAPLLMIGLVAALVYLPGLSSKPQYDFVYVTADYYGEQYIVQDGKIVRKTPSESEAQDTYYIAAAKDETLYRHDVATNQSKEISFEAAQQLRINTNPKAPDGFEVDSPTNRNYYASFFFIFNPRRDYDTYYLKGNNVSKKLALQPLGGSVYRIRILGWIEK